MSILSPDATHAPILVSACLLGVPCRYDGKSCPVPELIAWASSRWVIPFCPEVEGGLPTPRLPSEIEGARTGLDGADVLARRTRVLRSDGVDVTAHFIVGAQAAAGLAHDLGIRLAILKSRSPSCGAGAIYDGRFQGTLVKGDGVTTSLLRRLGLDVLSELDLPQEEG